MGDVLPRAYAYVLNDCENDPLLRDRWESTVCEAMIFVDRREWVGLADSENCYFDDDDRGRFIPETAELRTATAGHLGNTPEEQERAAKALRLPLLSSAVEMEWSGEGGEPVDRDWVPRFDLACELLRSARSTERAEDDAGRISNLELRHSRELVLTVRATGGPAERVPVNARLQDGVLTVAGRPVQFGADAAKELLRHFSPVRRHGALAADLTGMLTAIADDADFQLAADKFRRAFAPSFVFGAPGGAAFAQGKDGETVGDAPLPTPDAGDALAEPRQGTEASTTQEARSKGTGNRESGALSGESETEVRSVDTPADGDSVETGSSGSSYTRDRALAKQKTIAKELRSALKGEIAPAGDDDDGSERDNETRTADDGSLGDEVYREIAAEYERACGRDPEMGAPRQAGWDLRSVDLQTGAKRLIEVKGKGCPWVKDEVVELSRAQVHKAFEMRDAERSDGAWYLYVVEQMAAGRFQVLPIENPVGVAGGWILSGEWREIALEPRVISRSGVSSG